MNNQKRIKISLGYKKIYDAYISMLMQQTAYFTRHHMEDSGLSEAGNELLFLNSLNPYSDLPMYKIEKQLMNKTPMEKEI